MDLSTFSLFSVKFLKDLYLTHCSIYVIQNKQFNDCQSGFIHGKYFESIWQGLAQSFILELKSYGVDGGLLKLMVKYLTGCQKWLF